MIDKEELITMLQDVIVYIKGRSITEDSVSEKLYTCKCGKYHIEDNTFHNLIVQYQIENVEDSNDVEFNLELAQQLKSTQDVLKEAREVIYDAMGGWNEKYYTQILNKIDGVLKCTKK